MLLTYVNHVQFYINQALPNEASLHDYLSSQVQVALAKTEHARHPVVHTFNATMHMLLLESHLATNELSESEKNQAESLWRSAMLYAQQQMQTPLNKTATNAADELEA